MEGKVKNWLLGIGIAIILIIPMIVNSINSNRVEVKTFSDFEKSVGNLNFALFYVGTTDKDEYGPYKDFLINLRKQNKITVFTVDTSKLTSEERSKLKEYNSEFQMENVFGIIKDGKVVWASSNKLSEKDLQIRIDKYLNNIIPDDEIAYKTVSTYKEYMDLVNSKKVTMAVFGRNSCGWCNKYKPVYNEVADEEKVDIYYFDSDSFDKNEYSKIMNSGLMIPASCAKNKEEAPLSSGFGTPLTIFTKNGKSFDCISGYVDKDALVAKLKSVGLIK